MEWFLNISGRDAVPVPEHLDLGSDFEFPAQTGQLAISPPSNAAPSPFMQFAASMPNHGTWHGKNKSFSVSDRVK